ncbi:MAG: hypothetical protein HOW73_03325 [Polyangiaceae bacterium]|nr:hypothetical protein [Polyangiaceae bacterium]
MKPKTMQSRSVLSLLGASLFLLVGCGDVAGDRIESICDCEDCGDRQYEEVNLQVEADLEIAEAYDCVDLIEPYWECQLDRHECDDGHYRDDHEECEHERDEFFECLDAKSTREGGPYF